MYALHELGPEIRPPFLRVARCITPAEIDGKCNQCWINFFSEYLRVRRLRITENINFGIPYLRTPGGVPMVLSNINYLDTAK